MAQNTGSLTGAGSVVLTRDEPRANRAVFGISGTYGTLTALIEGSNDGSVYHPLAAVRLKDGVLETTTISPSDNTTLSWLVPCAHWAYVRFRCVGLASGTVAVTAYMASDEAPLSLNNPSVATVALLTVTGGLTVTTADVTITDVNVVLSAVTGTKIGTATTQKLGFFNATPVAQRSAYTQTYSTADKTHANPTATALTVTDGAGTNDGTIGAITNNASTITAVQELAASINAIIVDLADLKALVNSVIDDLQALGLVG